MKKIKLLLGIVAMSLSLNLGAQHEVKTNVLGLLFNQFGATYEYVLEDNLGIGASISYFTPPSSFSYDYSAFAFTPEVKYYIDPTRRDADKYFVGGYLKYRNTVADEYLLTFDDDGNDLYIGQTTNGLAIGIMSGRKWVTKSGFTFETWAGFGRYLFTAESYTDGYDPDEADDIFGDLISSADDLPSWDVRVGITLGWRFGK